MAPITGKNGSFQFSGTTYASTDCIQSHNLDDAINEVIYACGGFEKFAAGNQSVTFTATLALGATDVAKVSNLAPGSNATDFEYHPAGDTSNYIEYTSTDANVISFPVGGGPNGIITGDVTIRLNNLTRSTAT